MSTLHNADPYNPQWLKYNRKHLIDMFDALHTKDGFSLSLENCPERNTPRSIQYKRAPKFNINEDSDASVIDSDVDGDGDPNSAPFDTDDNATDTSLPSFPDVNDNHSRVATDTDGMQYGDGGDEDEDEDS